MSTHNIKPKKKNVIFPDRVVRIQETNFFFFAHDEKKKNLWSTTDSPGFYTAVWKTGRIMSVRP